MDSQDLWLVVPTLDELPAFGIYLDELAAMNLRSVPESDLTPRTRQVLATTEAVARKDAHRVLFLSDLRTLLHERGGPELADRFEGMKAAEELRCLAMVQKTVTARQEGVHVVRSSGYDQMGPVSKTGRMLSWDLDLRLITELLEEVRAAVETEIPHAKP